MSGLTNVNRLFRRIKDFVLPSARWCRQSFSQEGEDLVLERLLDGKISGFYVEVGSHHPYRFSNTYLFYKRGWRGICIDPLPGSKTLFKKYRPRDISLELGVSLEDTTMLYYIFNEPALNTFDENLAFKRNGLNGYTLVDKRTVRTLPLHTILREHLRTGEEITFLSVDVEGFDLEVLKSNDWVAFRPMLIVAECLETELINIAKDSVVKFMRSVGYTPKAKTGQSVIFSDDQRDLPPLER